MLELIVSITYIVAILTIAVGIGFIVFAAKTRLKQIDRVVLGYEFPHDSIFTQVMRVPNYGMAFVWGWAARRMGLEGKIAHFGMDIRWPFVVSFVLFSVGLVCFILASIVHHYFEL